MGNFVYELKEILQVPVFWLVISGYVLCIAILFLSNKFVVISLFVLLFWFLSITPFGASLFLGSLTLLDSGAEECTDEDINSLIVMPGGLSWQPDQEGHKLSPWSIIRADRAIEVLKTMKNTQVILPGGLGRGKHSEAQLLKDYIQSEAGISDYVIGESSNNTFENLVTLMPLLSKDKGYLLVTSYWHMARAKRVAEKLSIIVCPVATKFEMNWSLIPNFKAHWDSKAAIHEWLGLAWYRVTGRI